MPAGSPSGGVGVGSGTAEDPALLLGPSALSSTVNDNGSAVSVGAAEIQDLLHTLHRIQ